MNEIKHFCTGGLHFSVELDAPWHFMEYTAPVAERIQKAAAGEVPDLLPIRAGDEIPARTLVKSRSELPENFNAHTLDFSQYEPFATVPSDEEMLRFKVAGDTPEWAADISDAELIMDVSNIDPGYKIYRRGGDTIFEFLKIDGVRSGFLKVPENCRVCEFTAEAGTRPYAAMSLIDFALRIACTYISSHYGALMIHSSVVSIDGKANLFLGASGTGKSTHSRLWLDNIPGAELVNDDNPILRVENGQVFVYGTPWSGKTPCYRNVKVPVGAIVKLSQAPQNSIKRLKGLDAYANIVGSVSSIRWSRKIMDEITSLMSQIAMTTPCFAMDCLPDSEAAFICRDGIINGTKHS